MVINTSAFATLKVFGDFACKYGLDSSAVARLDNLEDESGILDNSKRYSPVRENKTDKAYAFTRSTEDKRANNTKANIGIDI